MRVVLLNNFYYLRGGSEKVFLDELEMLNALGHDAIPFSRRHEKNVYSEYSNFFPMPMEYDGNVSLWKKFFAGLKLIYSYECSERFYRLIDSFNPNIIHAHNIYGRLTSSVIDTAKKRTIQVVMTLHDYKLICPSYLMLLNGRPCERCKGGNYYNCLFTRCHRRHFFPSMIYTAESYFNAWFKKYNWIKYFICPSNFSREKHLETGISEERLIYMPNFIKIENFDPDYSTGSYILFGGRLSKEKGILTLLKAVRGIGIKLKVVGDGPIRDKLETFINENEIDNVIFEGYKSGENLRDLFRNAAFLVFPSELYENAPMTILEAFGYGKPVVGSNIGGIPEMVVEGKTGLLFEPGNAEDLREKINYFLNHPSEIVDMGKNARKKVEREYTADLHYQRLIEVYQKALS
jgi:glycosyltransferase involved in cell wall biosynthesis